MTALFVIVQIIGSAGLWMFLFTYLFENRWAKGTQQRFILRSVRKPTQYIAVMYFAVQLVVDFRKESWFWFALDVFNFTWIALSIRKFNNEDEDDIWKRGKKWAKRVWAKLKKRAREFKPVLVPRPVPIPVGGAA